MVKSGGIFFSAMVLASGPAFAQSSVGGAAAGEPLALAQMIMLGVLFLGGAAATGGHTRAKPAQRVWCRREAANGGVHASGG